MNSEAVVDARLKSRQYFAYAARALGLFLLLFTGFLILFGVWGQRQREERWSDERSVASMIRALYEIERQFQSGDLDKNGVADFWTGDVAGLYYLEVGGTPLRLISQELAAADASPLRQLPFPKKPYHGYYFVALDRDDSTQPPEVYRQDTDGKSGKVHHRTKFGICAYPADPGVTGSRIYITGDQRNQLDCPARGVPIPKAWPPDSEMRNWNVCSGGG